MTSTDTTLRLPAAGCVYDRWSKSYDATFGRLLSAEHYRAVAQLHLKSGDRVLDVGVGTGIMLSCFPPDVSVVGFDLSQDMLQVASRRCRAAELDNCHLIRADAVLPPLAEESFDHVIISHTISVVSDHERLLTWAARLIRPAGRVVVLNHFRSDRTWIGWLEKRFNPLFVKLGWRSDLALEEVLATTSLRMVYRFKMHLVDLWQIIVLQHLDQQQPLPLAVAPPPIDEPALHAGPSAMAALD